MISGSSNGGVQWAENRAGKGKTPELASFQTVIEAASATEYGQPLREVDLKGPHSASRVWVDDVNGDGKLDLLVGDSVTLIEPKGLTDEEFKQKFADWQKEIQAASEALSKAPEDETARAKANDEYRKLYAKKAEFMTEEMTGFVWLYLRK